MEEIQKTKYTDAQKKATKKYRENNKDKVNEQRKKYYQNRKTKDPSFLEYKRLKAKEYYQKKKDLKNKPENKVIEEIKEEIKVEPVKELIIENIVEHISVDEKKKRKYVRRNKSI